MENTIIKNQPPHFLAWSMVVFLNANGSDQKNLMNLTPNLQDFPTFCSKTKI